MARLQVVTEFRNSGYFTRAAGRAVAHDKGIEFIPLPDIPEMLQRLVIARLAAEPAITGNGCPGLAQNDLTLPVCLRIPRAEDDFGVVRRNPRKVRHKS
jgi:hypothetical protein